MEKTGTPREKISALADGELEQGELDAVLANLRRPEGRREWDLYHQIGDVLRSDDMDVELSPNFAARMSARLDAEPTILAPAASAPKSEHATLCSKVESVKRFAIPGIAAALAIFTAYLVAPQVTTGDSVNPAGNFTSPALASVNSQAIASASSKAVLSIPVNANPSHDKQGAVDQETAVLRDPNIDEYLVAHQRYSPSLYDTTQFVRSAAFETEPKK